MLLLLALLSTLLFEPLQSPVVPADDDKDRFAPKVKPAMSIERATSAIKIDGRVDEPAWADAARADGFVEVQPGNQVRALVETEALITYDSENLYVAFRAYDDRKSVRVSLRNRDEVFEDDWVGVILDTYGDATQGYEIFVNPLGIQGDLMRASNDREDAGFDMVFRSRGHLTDTGYEVELAIPFSSLRFPDREVQNWNVTFLRNHPRDIRRVYSWATVDQKNSCIMCQLGSINGIKGVKPGNQLKLIPAFVGTQAGALRDDENPGQGFDNGRVHPQLSLTARYDFTPSLAAEATLNPDFSQVESDAQQIDVNTTFALFYPERRPFFQEGSDLFQTPFNIVYTRSINNPISAVKLTGKAGSMSMAVLSAVDDDSPLLVPFEERSELVRAGRSVSNVVRALYALGSKGHIGGMITDRRIFDGGSGSVVSIDGRYRLWNQYNLTAQLALSNTAEANSAEMSEDLGEGTFYNGRHTVALDGEHFTGRGLYAEFNRSDRHWNFEFWYRGTDPNFRTDNGFVTNNGRQTIGMFQAYAFYPKNSFISRLQPGFIISDRYRWTGARSAYNIQSFLNAQLKGQTYLNLGYSYNWEHFRGLSFDRLYGWNASISSQWLKWLNGGFYLNQGREIARNEDVPVRGRFRNIGAFLDFKPVQRLSISPSVDFAEMKQLGSNDLFFRGYILRVRTGLQFTRELSVRLVTQYNDFAERVSLEPLVSYQINPFTVFYVGSTHSVGEFGNGYGYVETQRQLFFKFQYLFQR